MKYMIQVPKIVREALIFDKINGSTLWKDTIAKEMRMFELPLRS